MIGSAYDSEVFIVDGSPGFPSSSELGSKALKVLGSTVCSEVVDGASSHVHWPRKVRAELQKSISGSPFSEQ